MVRCVLRSSGFFLLLYSYGFAATLSISNQTANPGQTVATSVLLTTGGAAIAGIQFDLQWDPGLHIQVSSGGALGQAYKVLYATPLGPRILRCLMVGVNQTSFADGSVANLFISTDSNAAPGAASVNLANVVATDGFGGTVALQPSSASVQIQNGEAQSIPAGSVLNAASMLPGAVAPGEIVTLLGSFPVVPPILLVGSVPAPILYAGAGQINAAVPFGMDLSGPIDLQIRGQNETVAEQSIPVATLAPAIFTQSGTGTGPGAILNQDYSLNTFLAPASGNSTVMVYGTGFGSLQTLVPDGQPVNGAILLAIPVSATVGGVPAKVTYAGSAPGLMAGVTQINVQVPEGLPSNPYTPIVLSIGSHSTPLGVTVAIVHTSAPLQ